MKRILILIILLSSVLPGVVRTLEAATNNNKYCYSVYHLQQQLNYSINFAGNVQKQRTKIDVSFHVREILSSSKNRPIIYAKDGAERKIRTFIAFIVPNVGKVDGTKMDMSKHYHDPFLVLVDSNTGELIDLKSTTKEQSRLNEYLSFFDLFQYSEHEGKYKYRNGNGRYQASISNIDNEPGQLIKKNTGYLKTTGKKSSVQKIQKSYLSITLAESEAECFYQKSSGVEIFKTTLSTKAFVEGDAKITVESDLKRALPSTHFFYTLTDDLSTWPSFNVVKAITREEAFSKLPVLMAKLSSLIRDDSEFVKTMLVDKNIWPYLADYILENGLSNELSIQLFWALDKIDTTESVSALTNLATSPLSDRDQLRAVLALGSTSAPFAQDSVDMLKNHMGNFTNTEYAQPEKLTFVRMLGAMASRRSDTDPLQSGEIKQFLYSQAGSFEEPVNAAVIDAIGNLKDSIDSQGEDILLQGLSKTSDKLRQSAASAFKRVPYNLENSEVLINQLANERNLEIKNTLIEVLGKTDNTDVKVKHQLLSLLGDERNPSIKNKSLESLKKINYDLQPEDIDVLASTLRQESNVKNQKLLAALILKQRRKP